MDYIKLANDWIGKQPTVGWQERSRIDILLAFAAHLATLGEKEARYDVQPNKNCAVKGCEGKHCAILSPKEKAKECEHEFSKEFFVTAKACKKCGAMSQVGLDDTPQSIKEVAIEELDLDYYRSSAQIHLATKVQEVIRALNRRTDK